MADPNNNEAPNNVTMAPSDADAGEDSFRTISEAIPGLLWFCDTEGRCNYASPRCREYTGTDFIQARGRGGFNFAHPEDDARIQEAWTESIRTGRNHDTELRLRRHDGVYRWHRAYGIPERDDHKAVKRWVIVCIDIDEAKRVQQESADMRATLLKAKEELERTVTERTAQLQEVVEQLEAFAYSIAHDMRAPLRTMHQYADMVAADYAAHLPEAAHRYLRKITAASEKLDCLIREVLVYTRVSQGSMTLRPIDLDRLLAEVLIMFPQFSAPNIELDIRGPLHCVIGDETALTQVFSNLMTNAVKFMPAERKPKIKIWTEPRDEYMRIFIKDNGIGVPTRDRERIFQMFERLQPEAEYEGSGIGLTIVRRAVERMSGKIGVESTAGNGTIFWIELKQGDPC